MQAPNEKSMPPCAPYKYAMNLVNLLLCVMAALMMFSACFSYVHVTPNFGGGQPVAIKSRYLPTLQALPWLTLWVKTQNVAADCTGLGLTTTYSGVCGTAPTAVSNYAQVYDNYCPATPNAQATQDEVQLEIDTCSCWQSCVFSGNVVLGFSILSFVGAVGASYGSWTRWRKTQTNSGMIAIGFSSLCCILTMIAFFSFYACGNCQRYILNQTFLLAQAPDPASTTVPPALLTQDVTLGAGGAGICAMLSWLIFVFVTATNFFMGVRDDHTEAEDLNAPLNPGQDSYNGLAEGGNGNASQENPAAGVDVAYKPNV